MAEPQRLSCPATLEDVRRIAEHIRTRCAEEGVDDMAAMELELAVVEAANNVVLHGYAGASGEIAVSLALADGGVEVTIEDSGKPIPSHPGPSAAAPLTAESGRGLALIAACTDGVRYAADGGVNRLTLFKALAAG